MSVSTDGKITSARLMGRSDQCLEVDWPYHRWCVLPFPHQGDHQYNLERSGRLLFEEQR